MKTEEEILKEYCPDGCSNYHAAVLKAIKAYADQFRSQHVEQEIERLRNDLKRAEEYKPQIEDQAKTERVMVIAAELESEYQQEIERLKEEMKMKVDYYENKQEQSFISNSSHHEYLTKRIAELEAQLKDANKVFEWFRARKSSDGPVSSKQNQPQPEKFKDEIPQLAQSIEGTYATTGKPDNLNERIYSLSDLGNSAKKLHDAVGKMEKEEQSELINFAVWYSGMEREKVINAYNRYKTETRKHHE